jgi:hypothetical protein
LTEYCANDYCMSLRSGSRVTLERVGDACEGAVRVENWKLTVRRRLFQASFGRVGRFHASSPIFFRRGLSVAAVRAWWVR